MFSQRGFFPVSPIAFLLLALVWLPIGFCAETAAGAKITVHSSGSPSASASIYTGKSPFQTLPPKPAALSKPAPAPKPAAGKTAGRKMAIAETGPSLVNLVKKAPTSVAPGETFCCETVVAAQCDVAEVVVTEDLPGSVSFIRSEPPVIPANGRLCWKWPTLNRGDVKTLKVYLQAEKAGDLSFNATVTANPRVNLSINVAPPKGARNQSEKAGQAENPKPANAKP